MIVRIVILYMLIFVLGCSGKISSRRSFLFFFAQDALSSDEMRHAKMKMSLNMKMIHILLFTSCHSNSQHLCVCRGVASGGKRVTACIGPRGLWGPRSPTTQGCTGHREHRDIPSGPVE